VRRSKDPNSYFIATHTGFGADFAQEEHFSCAPEQHRRYWKLYINRSVAKGEIITV